MCLFFPEPTPSTLYRVGKGLGRRAYEVSRGPGVIFTVDVGHGIYRTEGFNFDKWRRAR